MHYHRAEHWVVVSGVAEIVLGFLLLFKKARIYALWGIILMLVIFMLVHFNMLNPQNSLGNPLYLLIIRILIQFFLIYCCWFYIKQPKL